MPSYINDDVSKKNEVDSDLDDDDDDLDDDDDIEEEEADTVDEDDDYSDDEKNELDKNDTAAIANPGETDDENDVMDLEEDNDQYDMDNEENDDDYDDREDLFQKFNNYSLVENLEKEHPEIRSVNIDEIKALTKIVRDKNGRIIDPLHTTVPFLTKYEKARIIGARAEQLERGAPTPLQNQLPESVIHGRTIALAEFDKKLIPFIIARPLPNKGVEYWKIQDLEIL